MLIIVFILAIATVVISVQCLKSLPVLLQRVVMAHPLLEIMFNFALSAIIMIFTGGGLYAGAANLAGSLVFAVYCEAYYKKKLG